MNILLITQSLSGGGAEKVAANLSIALSQWHKVYLVSWRKDDKEYNHTGERIVFYTDSSNVLTRLINVIRRVFFIKRLKKKLSIDYSISFVPQCDYPNVFAATKDSKRIVEVSSNMTSAFRKRRTRVIRRIILKRADYVVAVSKGVECDLIRNWAINPNRIKTIYNSIDLEQIRKSVAREPFEKYPFKYIVAMGSYRKAKGHWHLIKAFSTITDKLHGVKLVILGDGEYRDKYFQLSHDLGIEEHVVFSGFIDNPFPILSRSEFMVFSSIYEGFGNAIIEAMACGVPVISTDCNYGPKEIIAPYLDTDKHVEDITITPYGILIPPFDLSDIDISCSISVNERRLGEAMLRLYEDLYLRNSIVKATEKYCEKYSNNSFGRQWNELLSALS